MAGRRIFVGDVQGCRVELERLLERLRFAPGVDELHPVGDFVNRGPDNLGTLRLCRDLEAGGVLGNHDLHLLRTAAGLRAPKTSDTMHDVLEAPDRDELLRWLAARPFLRTWDDLYCVHAGLHPKWTDPRAALAGLDPVEPHPAATFATRVRYCTAEGELPEDEDDEPGPPFAPWDEFYPPHPAERRRVVFGHWSVRGLVRRGLVRGLDTGCVWGGRLTAWIAEEDRLVHVPAERAWATPAG